MTFRQTKNSVAEILGVPPEKYTKADFELVLEQCKFLLKVKGIYRDQFVQASKNSIRKSQKAE